jgi:hypothetical protein
MIDTKDLQETDFDDAIWTLYQTVSQSKERSALMVQATGIVMIHRVTARQSFYSSDRGHICLVCNTI